MAASQRPWTRYRASRGPKVRYGFATGWTAKSCTQSYRSLSVVVQYSPCAPGNNDAPGDPNGLVSADTAAGPSTRLISAGRRSRHGPPRSKPGLAAVDPTGDAAA